MIPVTCAACRARMEVPERFAGQKWTCGVCGAETVVPGYIPPVPPFPDPLNASPVQVPTSGKAIASLVLGLLTLFGTGFCLTGIVGIIVGRLALDDINSGITSGREMARAGITLCIVGLVWPILAVFAMMFLMGLAGMEELLSL